MKLYDAERKGEQSKWETVEPCANSCGSPSDRRVHQES